MKIALAQINPIKGNIQENIKIHEIWIKKAISENVDLIVFPELSITAYEPKQASDLACKIEDARFEVFQKLADHNHLSIAIGAPTKSSEGINISMIIFQPNQKKLLYSKRFLHDDELPFFVSGKHQPFLVIRGEKIAFGICYETLKRELFTRAAKNNADIFIASVAKPESGLNKAYLHFPSVAKEFRMPVLMVNSIGYCDDFLSNGKSSVWNEKGELLAQLSDKEEDMLIYNSESQQIDFIQ